MPITWDEYKLTITLQERMLGTIPKDDETFTTYIKDKTRALAEKTRPGSAGPEEDEQVIDVDALEEKGWTTFYTDEEGRPVILDYQVKGFLKEAGNVIKGELGVAALRNHVENTVFVFPRRTVLADHVDGFLERPLRAMTMQGPRVTLARSDFIEAGKEYVFTIKVMKSSKVKEDILTAILDYGQFKGLGQWRNGGYGSFTYKLEKLQ